MEPNHGGKAWSLCGPINIEPTSLPGLIWQIGCRAIGDFCRQLVRWGGRFHRARRRRERQKPEDGPLRKETDARGSINRAIAMGCIIHGWLAWGGWSFSGWSGGSTHQSVCVVAGGAGVCFGWAHSDGRVNPVMVMRGFLFRSQACFFVIELTSAPWIVPRL